MKQGFLYVLLVSLFAAFIATLAGHAGIQRALRTGTEKVLEEDPALAGVLAQVEIEFRGQEAFISGVVGSREELARLEASLLKAALPARFGKALPAVTRVHHAAVQVAEAAPQ